MNEEVSRFFQLNGYDEFRHNKHNLYPDFVGAVVVTPEELPVGYVKGAWNHAVRKTAPELEKVDYEAAVQWLRERHPEWQIFYPYRFTPAFFSRSRKHLEDYPVE